MIPIVGLMLAAYGAARLLQVPIEHSALNAKVPLLLVISVIGIGALALGALALIVSGTNVTGLVGQ